MPPNTDRPEKPPIDFHDDGETPQARVARKGVTTMAGLIGATAVLVAAAVALFLWWSPTA